MTRREVAGIDCFAGGLDAAAAAVIGRAQSGKGGIVCLANVHVAMTAQRDPGLRQALKSAWMVLPDGAPLAWMMRRHDPASRRIAGPDLMPAVLDRGRAHGLRHFLFGSTDEVVQMLESRLRAEYPGVEIVGSYAPPIGSEDAADSLARIETAQSDIVWVALGAPKQELWAWRHAPSLGPIVLVAVGAAFDFLAGRKARAPRWMQRAGLEWLHRFVHEPRRLGWRYLSTNTLFALMAFRRSA